MIRSSRGLRVTSFWIPAFAGMTYHKSRRHCNESIVFADTVGVPGSSVSWIPAFAGMTYRRNARLCVPSFLRRQESITLSTEPRNSQPIYPITTAPHTSSFLRPGSSTKRLRFVGVERQESITPITQQNNNHPTSQPHAS